MRDLPSESIDCVWTDPPYFLSSDGPTCANGRRVSVNKGAWDRSAGLDEDFGFQKRWLQECHRILKPAGNMWVTGTFHVHAAIGFAMQSVGFRILNDIVWRKPSPPPNLGTRTFTHATELIWWGTKAARGSAERYTFHYDDMKRENGGKQMSNVWTMAPVPRSEKVHGKHPTQKPVALVDRCLRASTNSGDIVFDPFAGSGTTGVAALWLGRHFIGCEIEEDSLSVAVRRLADCAQPLAATA